MQISDIKLSLFYAPCGSLVQFIAGRVSGQFRAAIDGVVRRGVQRGVVWVVRRAGRRKGRRAGHPSRKRAPPSPAALGGLTGSVPVHRHRGPVPRAAVVLLAVTRKTIR